MTHKENPKMEQSTHDKIKEIKKSLRLSMNGVVSTLQRKQGLNYKINFGVETPRLKETARRYALNRELAVALWSENIRECKILAILLMPKSDFTATDAAEWIASTRYTEIADQLSMHLLCTLPDAASHAISWNERNEGLFAYCGFMTLSHLFRQGVAIDESVENKYLEQAAEILNNNPSANNVLKMCVHTSLLKYLSLQKEHTTDKIMQNPKLKHFFT